MRQSFCIEFIENVSSNNVNNFFYYIKKMDKTCPDFRYFRKSSWSNASITCEYFQEAALKCSVNGRYSIESYEYDFDGNEIEPAHDVFSYFGNMFNCKSERVNDILWVLPNFDYNELNILNIELKRVLSSKILK